MKSLDPKLRRILVVEDDGEMRQLLRDFLTSRGYSVTTAASALKALGELAAPGRPAPDLVISDVDLGAMSGLELARRICDERKIPVVLISGFGGDEEKKAALSHGASRFLPKPFGLGEMAQVVEEELRKAA